MSVIKSPPTEIITSPDGVEHLLVPAASLSVISNGGDVGAGAGVARPLKRGALVVGSGPECDLVLTDGAVSRRQFELLATPEGFLLRDLGSTNGTFVGDLRVREVLVGSGTEILVGRTRLRFEAGGDGAAAESLPLSPRHRFGSLIGASARMRRCFALLERAAETTSTVLIEGESGTGKELAAESLHQLSARADGPFVVVDCGAIAPTLIESELSGHERGAFTGAVAEHAGAFERAHGGTLFLDEVGELPLEMQVKLLRLVEKREVRRLGGRTTRPVDVRIVAATNRALDEMVERGELRRDLFYRLAVIRVELPPLRQRREDVPLLALELAARLRPDADPPAWVSERALQAFASYDWPGNVRELRNVIERLAALPELRPEVALRAGGGAGIRRGEGEGGDDGGQAEALARLPYHDAKARILDAFERSYVRTLLDQEGGVVARAAARAGVPRQTFFRLIQKHGLVTRE